MEVEVVELEVLAKIITPASEQEESVSTIEERITLAVVVLIMVLPVEDLVDKEVVVMVITPRVLPVLLILAAVAEPVRLEDPVLLLFRLLYNKCRIQFRVIRRPLINLKIFPASIRRKLQCVLVS